MPNSGFTSVWGALCAYPARNWVPFGALAWYRLNPEKRWQLLAIATSIRTSAPPGICFQGKDTVLMETSEVTAAVVPVSITINGHAVRDPHCLRYYPSNLGRVTCQTNNPNIAAITFAESDFFTKKIN
ncbi:hypothetical protein EYZ11_000214 [Aspergillus tanneri]|uniref:Uncharacterized protein n=1 Tax=Aspergillus tanneri TaxID=1220188 RepID=A0A4V3UQT9_9EURO|nr:hypothetical protein EYZ11_000214 [Aspergillus tanneri]